MQCNIKLLFVVPYNSDDPCRSVFEVLGSQSNLKRIRSMVWQVSDELKTAVRHFQWLKNEYYIRGVQLEADLWKHSVTYRRMPFLLRADTMSPLESKSENNHMLCWIAAWVKLPILTFSMTWLRICLTRTETLPWICNIWKAPKDWRAPTH